MSGAALKSVPTARVDVAGKSLRPETGDASPLTAIADDEWTQGAHRSQPPRLLRAVAQVLKIEACRQEVARG